MNFKYSVSLPPLPESGPTLETAIQEETKLPIVDPASAHSTPQDNPEEETGEEVEQVVADASDESDAEQGPRKPKRQRLVLPESSSTEDVQRDTGNSAGMRSAVSP